MTAFVYNDIIVYPFINAWAVAARLEVAGSCKTDDMNSLLLVSSLHSGFSSGHGISGDTKCSGGCILDSCAIGGSTCCDYLLYIDVQLIGGCILN